MMSLIDQPNTSKPTDANITTQLGTIRQFGHADFSGLSQSVAGVSGGR